MPDPASPDPASPQSAGAGGLEQLAPRVAALAIAAPLAWCGIGVVMVSLLHRPMAAFAARYAALHAVSWPQQRDAQGNVSLLLHAGGTVSRASASCWFPPCRPCSA